MSLFFGDLNMKVFRLLSLFRFSINALWWNCALWIDDNMHWALIVLFCDTFFVYKTIEFSAVALAWLASAALKKLHAILCLKETIGFDWVWFFGDINLRILFTLLSVRCFIDCNCDETVLFELMITCTGLWLTCFVILFLYTRLLSIPRLLSPGLLLLLWKSYMQFCASRKRLALTESDFLET